MNDITKLLHKMTQLVCSDNDVFSLQLYHITIKSNHFKKTF